MITEKMLERVKKRFVGTNLDYPVVLGELEYEEWLKAGKPRTIVELETTNGFIAAADTSYGICLLFQEKDDLLLGCGQYDVISRDVIMIDKEYHGATRYLWF